MKLPILLPLLLAAAVVVPCGRAGAATCALDRVPAATLLLPYFDLDARDLGKKKAKRENTILSVTNLGPAPAIGRVTIWTDASVPTLAFDLYLTGYDVADIDLWKVFSGEVPADPCQGGEGSTTQLPPEKLETLRLAHSGQAVPAFEGLCAGTPGDGGRLRGYVTIDSVITCVSSGPVFPSDLDYFGANGIAADENVLGGQYEVFRKGKLLDAGELVAIEADPSLVNTSSTFYGRYVNFTGQDHREPLPSIWGLRYRNQPDRKRTTELAVWRSSDVAGAPFACGELAPLEETQVVAFDDAEDAIEVQGVAFPAETNRVPVEDLAIPFEAGWLYLNLASPTPNSHYQSYVTVRDRNGPIWARGRVQAIAFDASCTQP
jgi:hypothetical protein